MIVLRLTAKQVEAITSALFEWSHSIDAHCVGATSRAEAKYMRKVLDSIYRQAAKQPKPKR